MEGSDSLIQTKEKAEIIKTVASQIQAVLKKSAADKLTLVKTLVEELSRLKPCFERVLKENPSELTVLEELATILGRWSVAYDMLQFPLAVLPANKTARLKSEIQTRRKVIDEYAQALLTQAGSIDISDEYPYLLWCRRLSATKDVKPIAVTATRTTDDASKSQSKRKSKKKKKKPISEIKSVGEEDTIVEENSTDELALDGDTTTEALNKKIPSETPSLIFPYDVKAIRKEHEQRYAMLSGHTAKKRKPKRRTAVSATQSNESGAKPSSAAQISSSALPEPVLSITSPSVDNEAPTLQNKDSPSADIALSVTQASPLQPVPIIEAQPQIPPAITTLSVVAVASANRVVIPTVITLMTTEQLISHSANVITNEVVYQLSKISNSLSNHHLLADNEFLDNARSKLVHAYVQFCTILDKKIFFNFEMDVIYKTIANLALALHLQLTPHFLLVLKHSIDTSGFFHQGEPRQPIYLYPYLATKADSFFNNIAPEVHPQKRKKWISTALFYYEQSIQLANLYTRIRQQDKEFQIWLAEVNERCSRCQEMLLPIEGTSTISLYRQPSE